MVMLAIRQATRETVAPRPPHLFCAGSDGKHQGKGNAVGPDTE